MDPNGIPLNGIFDFMHMSTCPETDDMNWVMQDICDQKDVDRADIQTDEEKARYQDNLSRPFSTINLKIQFHSFSMRF